MKKVLWFGVSLFLVACSKVVTPEILNENGDVLSGSIAEMTYTDVNGMEQFLLIRGDNTNNPVILFLHGGPGSPETGLVTEYLGDLEKDYTIVCWEQRGAGKSFSKDLDYDTLTVEDFISDGVVVTDYLRERFGQDKIYLIGHSWGSYLGMRLAHDYSDRYLAYLGLGQFVNLEENEKGDVEMLLAAAEAQQNKKALKQLSEITFGTNGFYVNGFKDVGTVRKCTDVLGGSCYNPDEYDDVKKAILSADIYNFNDKVHYVKGVIRSLTSLFNESFLPYNLRTEVPEISIPVTFVSGDHDMQVALFVTTNYYENLVAADKELYIISNAGHFVINEHPEEFMDIVRERFE